MYKELLKNLFLPKFPKANSDDCELLVLMGIFHSFLTFHKLE